MRSCDEIDVLMQLALDGLLDPSGERLLEEHLRECRTCRERYEQLRVMKAALASMEEPAPAGLHGSIMRYVKKNGTETTHAAPAAPKRRHTLRRWLAGAAALAACCGIALTARRMLPELRNEASFSMSAPNFSLVNDSASPQDDAESGSAAAGQTAGAAPSCKNEGPGDYSEITDTDNAADDPADGKLAIDLPPVDSTTGGWTYGVESTAAPAEARRVYVTGSRAALPQELTEGELRDATEDSEALDFILIDSWAADYWHDQLTAAGFSWEEADGQEMFERTILLFRWTDN